MIVILVEGDGDKKALPIILNRARGILSDSVLCIDMKGRSNMIREADGFEKTILRQSVPKDTAFFILLDQEGPRSPYVGFADEVAGMNNRASNMMATHGLPVRVLWAIREFESWLIGGLRKGSKYCNLSGIRSIPGDTQGAPLDPKAWLKAHRTPRHYDSNAQACLAKHIDVKLARQRNHSLDDLLLTI